MENKEYTERLYDAKTILYSALRMPKTQTPSTEVKITFEKTKEYNEGKRTGHEWALIIEGPKKTYKETLCIGKEDYTEQDLREGRDFVYNIAIRDIIRRSFSDNLDFHL